MVCCRFRIVPEANGWGVKVTREEVQKIDPPRDAAAGSVEQHPGAKYQVHRAVQFQLGERAGSGCRSQRRCGATAGGIPPTKLPVKS